MQYKNFVKIGAVTLCSLILFDSAFAESLGIVTQRIQNMQKEFQRKLNTANDTARKSAAWIYWQRHIQDSFKKNNTKMYIPLAHVYAGQILFSELNIEKKIKKGKSQSHDGGLAKFDFGEAAPAILTSFGVVLLDGHHTALASDRMGALHTPVNISRDLSHLSENQFWQQMIKENAVFFINRQGEPVKPHKMTIQQLSGSGNNFPLRYFFAEAALKCISDSKENLKFDDTKLMNTPLWIKRMYASDGAKLSKDIPFIEFILGIAAEKAGFSYKDGTDFTDKMLQDASEKMYASKDAQAFLAKYGVELDRITPPSEVTKNYRGLSNYIKYCPAHNAEGK